MVSNNTPTKEQIFQVLERVPDPEIPVLSVIDLGVIREVIIEDNNITVVITPTYSGCPAMDTITINIKSALQEAGYQNIRIKTNLSPAWTTDWMTESGKLKLKEYGIAPPVGSIDKNTLLAESHPIPCPRCNSINTEMISQFGSTACKSLYKCLDCLEPFDYFKCH